METAKEEKPSRALLRRLLPGSRASNGDQAESRRSFHPRNLLGQRDAKPASANPVLGSLQNDAHPPRDAAPPLAPPASILPARVLDDTSLSAVKLSSEELDVSTEIWNNAYDKLQTKSPKMVEIYEKILTNQLTTSS